MPVEFSLEFFDTSKHYFYTITVHENRIVDEFLSEIILGKEDRLVFHRKTNEKNENSIQFFNEFYRNDKNKLLKEIIENNILKPNQSLIDIIDEFGNDDDDDVLTTDEWYDIYALNAWLENDLIIVSNLALHNKYLPLQLNYNKDFKQFSIEVLSTYSTGIVDISIEKMPIEIFFGSNNIDEINKIINSIETNDSLPFYKIINNEAINFIKENNKFLAVQLKYIVYDQAGNKVIFRYNELSDGTKKLVDYLKVLDDVINTECTYIIDEIEKVYILY
jgi:hypothetical protein